jgi:hypothetical protein
MMHSICYQDGRHIPWYVFDKKHKMKEIAYPEALYDPSGSVHPRNSQNPCIKPSMACCMNGVRNR